MDNVIVFSNINDFIFCPASIFFHGMYEGVEGMLYQDAPQVSGSHAHKSIDHGLSQNKNVISSLFVYSEKYNICGKIDKYFIKEKRLVECKKHVKQVFDGYVFQLYSQYFGMIEAGYKVDELFIYSLDDNKKYPVLLPAADEAMLAKYKSTLDAMRSFSLDGFFQPNSSKCDNCIYSNICYWGVSNDEQTEL